MIGVSVSLYDKFDDLGVLLDIIRHNWEDEYVVSVCSNHANATERVGDLRSDIDVFQQGADISYSPDRDVFNNANMRYRIYDSIRTAVDGVARHEDVDHVLHVHTDAWPLSERRVHDVVEEMERRDASFGFKTRTEHFLNNYPPGHIMDQFMFFDTTDTDGVDFLSHPPREIFPAPSIHQLLTMQSFYELGWSGVYHYCWRENETYWDGTPVVSNGNPVRPMMYNPEFGQVHVAVEDFPGDLGRSLQAHYLQRHDIDAGERVEELLDRHLLPEAELFERLDAYVSELNDGLGLYGLSFEQLGWDVGEAKGLASGGIKYRLQRAAFLHARQRGRQVLNYLNTESNVVEGIDDVSTVDLHTVYDAVLDDDHFPDD